MMTSHENPEFRPYLVSHNGLVKSTYFKNVKKNLLSYLMIMLRSVSV